MSTLGFSIQEIVIAVNDIEAAATRLGGGMQAEVDEVVPFPQSGLEAETGGFWVGDFHVALVKPLTETSPVARLLEKRGEGLSEICLRTTDLSAAIEHMKSKGLRFVSEEPQILKDYRWGDEVFAEVHVVFVHPDSAHGVQIELQQWVK
jgi:methylmalonyl-CoA epimerase